MAKDNVPFHTVVFPATLLGTKEQYTFLDSINATGELFLCTYLCYVSVSKMYVKGNGVFVL